MSVLVVGGLALIGGLAAACFTKAFGIVFLGEPRTRRGRRRARGRRRRCAGRWSCWPACCVLIGLARRCGRPCCGRPWPTIAAGKHASGRGGERDASRRTIDGRHVRRRASCSGSIVFLAMSAANAAWPAAAWNGPSLGTAATPRPRRGCSTRPPHLPGRCCCLFRLFLRPRDEIHAAARAVSPAAPACTPTPPTCSAAASMAALRRRRLDWPRKLRWLQEGRIQLYVLYIAADDLRAPDLEARLTMPTLASIVSRRCSPCCWLR